MDITIREERRDDYKKTEAAVQQAFENETFSDKQEHFLVSRIRKSEEFVPELSLVATDPAGSIIGHILLSKIKIIDGERTAESLALAPVSVIPRYQNQRIGSRLIETALEKAKALGFRSAIVLGHKDYYPKFGFKPAISWRIRAPFDVADDYFMAIELADRALVDVQGVVEYPGAFSQ